MESLLVYDDSPVFGGHEVMSLHGLDGLLEHSEVFLHVFYSQANERLHQELTTRLPHPRLALESLAFHSSKIQSLLHHFQRKRLAELATRFRSCGAPRLLAIQGNIEHSSLGILAAKQAGIESLSYLPVPHSHRDMGAKGAFLRDPLTRPLFRKPDRFLTISAEMKRLLRLQGATAPIDIVFNGIDAERFQATARPAAKEKLHLPSERFVIGMVGRIEFSQKRQHLLVEAISESPSLRASSHLAFAGTGPDEPALRSLLQERGLADQSTLLGWRDPSEVYPALDQLVLPSRYEGVPLVMLEALACGVPVIASDRDGMRDLLPAAWRFPSGSASALRQVLTELSQHPPEADCLRLQTLVREKMNLQAFRQQFAESVLQPWEA